jgi:hypothetical protein
LGSFGAEEENVDFTVEGSFGENFLEIEGRDRYIKSSISSIFCVSSFYSIFYGMFLFNLLYANKKIVFFVFPLCDVSI